MRGFRNGKQIFTCDLCHEPLKNAAGRYKSKPPRTRTIDGREHHFHVKCAEQPFTPTRRAVDAELQERGELQPDVD